MSLGRHPPELILRLFFTHDAALKNSSTSMNNATVVQYIGVSIVRLVSQVATPASWHSRSQLWRPRLPLEGDNRPGDRDDDDGDGDGDGDGIGSCPYLALEGDNGVTYRLYHDR